MSEVAASSSQPACAGCGMHFTPLGRAKTARAPGTTTDLPVCSRVCQSDVERYGAHPGWSP